MPSGSFTWYKVRKFPSLSNFNYRKIHPTARQESLKLGKNFVPPEAPDEVYTEISLNKGSSIDGFHLFNVRHRSPVEVKGWWDNHFITELIEDTTFNLYYGTSRNKEIGECAITHVKKDISIDATKAIERGTTEEFKFELWEYDFKRIIESCVNLKGAWFENMAHARIKSEAAYGNEINKDPEFKRLLAIGALSNIIAHIEYLDRLVRINVSKIGSLYFMDNYPVDFCLGFASYMDQFLIPPTKTTG